MFKVVCDIIDGMLWCHIHEHGNQIFGYIFVPCKIHNLYKNNHHQKQPFLFIKRESRTPLNATLAIVNDKIMIQWNAL